ncbi:MULTISPECIES: YbaY family lipoprotein [unclassified Erwinia]|uniref:YbaY family lipoprotein n=1 Tax=unclassified Erwinia TaxID=2622719 RepID=UPI0006F70CC0|nr:MULTISPECIES: YbaY family lipoprotein [unclassified Erwinia]KQN54435.1 hypothetical protein ASF13_13515 [Erwinia sp. Leaf53]PLV59702.1 hypothetical protein NV64_13075 [Erwinia sp. B116]
MKLWHVVSTAALVAAIAGCADKSRDIATPTLGSQVQGQQTAIQQPNVSGTVWIRQKIALPPNAVLTVTLSDASLADAPSKVLSQQVNRTDGKQAPFQFVLPFNPAEIQPNARILLSAAVTVDGKMVFITDNVKQVITSGGTRQDLTLVPVPSVPVNTQSGATSTVPTTSPTMLTPSSAVPAPTSL